jgi:peptidoglycan/xylan/chitin deacetylase (PgdA/CDA1 family)
VDAHRRVAGQLVEAGHSIENHTQNHPSGWWWAADPWTVAREIASCSHAIRTATGMEPRMFRSPVGMTNPWVHRASAAAGLRVVGWSVSGGDACAVAPSRFVATLMRAISPGAIVLLHVGEGARHRCHALSLLLRELQADGYRCVLPHQEALC